MPITARLQLPTPAAGLLTTLGNGRHQWQADTGTANGGSDAAPDPHDLLDSALAACTTLTLALYIRRRQWPVTGLEVTVTHTDAQDAAGAPVYRMQRQIRIDGTVGEAERQRLLDLAGHCPLHKLLTGTVQIDSVLAPAGQA